MATQNFTPENNTPDVNQGTLFNEVATPPEIDNVPHSGNLPEDRGGERPVREFTETTLRTAVEEGYIDPNNPVPDYPSTYPTNVTIPGYLHPRDAEIDSSSQTVRHIDTDEAQPQSSRRGKILASLGLLGAAVAGVVAFALPKSSESESPIADTNTETTVSTDSLGQTTPIKSEEAAAPTSRDSNETEQARTYGEIMTADTPEEWLQKNNSNWTRALNTGDIRYVQGMFAEGINLTKQENTIVSFKAEKDSYGPEYQAKRGEILSIDSSTGFDDPDAKIRTIEAVVKNNYQKYIGVESYVVTKGKYTLVKEVLETGDGTFDVWVISAADEETIDKST